MMKVLDHLEEWIITFVMGAATVIIFLAVLIVQGAVMVRVNLGQLSSALEISMAWIYLAVPVGGVMMLGEYLGVLRRLWQGRAETTSPAAPVAVQ